MKRQKKLILTIALTFALVAVCVAAYVSFNYNINIYLRENVGSRLREMVGHNVISSTMQINEQVKKVRTMAEFFGQSGTLGDSEQKKLLTAAVEQNGLLRCAIAFPDGSFITHDDKNEGNVTNDEFFKSSMQGEFFISDPRPAVVDTTKNVILFACPIFQGEKIIGSLIYSYLCDEMDRIFNLRFLNGQGEMLIAKEDGTVLIGESRFLNGETNILTSFHKSCTHEEHAPDKKMELLGQSGGITITLAGNGGSLLLRYDRLAYNDWYVVSIAPSTAITHLVTDVAKSQSGLAVQIAICLAVYLIALLAIHSPSKSRPDKLTGAPPMAVYTKMAKQIIKANPDQPYAFIRIDIRGYKLIKRIYSSEIADTVIKNMALSIKEAISSHNGAYARIEGDIFVLMLPFESSSVLFRLRAAFISRFKTLMGPHFTSALEFPTGQYIFTPNGQAPFDIDDIIEKAAFAHRIAKQTVDQIVVDYTSMLETEAALQRTIEETLSAELTPEEFELYLQPIFPIGSETPCGAQAFLRWHLNGQQCMHPLSYDKLLTRSGFCVRMDKCTFDRATVYIAQELAAGRTPVPISVSFSSPHLKNQKFIYELCKLAEKQDVLCKYLDICLDETSIFSNLETAITVITQLHAAGFSVTMTGFGGSGYCPLSSLKELHVDNVKLDKSFFESAADEGRGRAVLSSIVKMLTDLGINTIAEGISSHEQAEMLREIGCTCLQGYLVPNPVVASAFSPGQQ